MTTALLFLLTGLAEISGGWMIWQWLRNGKPIMYGVVGALVLFIYGVLPTLQHHNFSRIYAAYGGAFIFLSLLWGYIVDKQRPDTLDIVGATICVVGAVVILLPRST